MPVNVAEIINSSSITDAQKQEAERQVATLWNMGKVINPGTGE